MRDTNNVFHLAIPSHDLDLACHFFVELLGCRLARRYSDRITLDFFGDQVVCHLDPGFVPEEPKMYPRHFGITFREKDDFDTFYEEVKEKDLPFFKDLFVRFSGKQEEHHTFFLCDPSNNLLEFKWYHDPEMMY
jgi:extradiol dioxygenase family protein